MNRLQAFLVRAANDLGLEVKVPFEVILPSGQKVMAEVLLPQLGAPKGMLVFQSDVWDISGALEKLGFACSMYDEPPPEEIFDLESYREMFSEWGWTADTPSKPKWMV
jgi:hypothetical protein